MARIYIGRATGIGSFERHVVLKLITPERANDETAVQMFLDEARLAASLNHQNVAQVFEVGQDSGIHYLAMEYVHGQDSRAVLAKAGSQGTRIPLELALTIVAGAAAGLNHAHERRGPDGLPLGIVHRDVSPSNIMIGYDGAVKLLDFGIAKATARSVETQSGIIKGKFAYMAPEQCRGREVDRRSDVFSLGIILYEISTQHRCFRADSDFDTMHRIVTGDVVRPTRLIPGYPQALEAIVMKALAVDPAQRYQTAGLLLEAIESFAISSRIPMSTMGLGRFMRDMFGEVPEPWLSASGSEPVVVRENTVSSTNGSGPVRVEPATVVPPETLPPEQLQVDGVPDSEAGYPDSDGVMAQTVLDLPRGGVQAAIDGLRPATSSTSHPADQPAPGPAYAPVPAEPPYGSPPLPPPPAAFAMNPGSSSNSHSHPGVASGPVSTRHGYASAVPSHGGMLYPRYEPSPEPQSSVQQLKPNRRALLIGMGIAILGIIVVIAVSMGRGKGDSADETRMSSTQPIDPPKTPPVVDDMVSVHLVSDPKGADVLIAGTRIGVTPLDKKLKRGTKVTQLTVHLAGYQDVSTKIDLGGDYSNDHIKLVKLEAPAQIAPPPPTPEKKPAVDSTSDKTADRTIEKKPVVKPPPPAVHKEPATTPALKCQPPGPNVDPFSSIPVCPK
jgi:serine/threonine-protein kinase